MNCEEIREYCLSLPGTTEGFPFNEDTLVFKVMGKMFCLMNLEGETDLSLKNSPERIIGMQELYPFVLPVYHMSKVHWTIVRLAAAPDQLLRQWIRESYELVVKGLTRQKKQELNTITGYDGI
jgi:predicted DNA-binding protein (MmcQ/YjbR family)